MQATRDSQIDPLPSWITLQEAAFLTGAAPEQILELVEFGRVDHIDDLSDPARGILLLRTADLLWAGFHVDDSQAEPMLDADA